MPNKKSNSQLMVIFVGTPGSGKSALAIQWCTIFQNWVRINQDELVTRWECKNRTHEALKQGKSVIIDRCNFDQNQRSVWMKIAQKYNVPVDCLEFRIPFEVLKQKIMSRKDHPTGIQGKRGVEILLKFANLIQSCHINEGSERIIVFPFAYQEPLFDIKTWNWLSKAFSVPFKFINSEQKNLVSLGSRTKSSVLPLMPWIIRCKKNSVNLKSNQDLDSPALKNYYDRLSKVESTTPCKLHPTGLKKTKDKPITQNLETEADKSSDEVLTVKDNQTSCTSKNNNKNQDSELNPATESTNQNKKTEASSDSIEELILSFKKLSVT